MVYSLALNLLDTTQAIIGRSDCGVPINDYAAPRCCSDHLTCRCNNKYVRRKDEETKTMMTSKRKSQAPCKSTGPRERTSSVTYETAKSMASPGSAINTQLRNVFPEGPSPFVVNRENQSRSMVLTKLKNKNKNKKTANNVRTTTTTNVPPSFTIQGAASL